uniref:Uncharacterized protein n=1 Tax=Aegilops tauschii subsp. strangulata TaxID=200361 RepID=A0A453EC20_AEGTS
RPSTRRPPPRRPHRAFQRTDRAPRGEPPRRVGGLSQAFADGRQMASSAPVEVPAWPSRFADLEPEPEPDHGRPRPFHDDPFLSFADGGAPAADVHVSGGGDDGFPASPDPYAFRHDSAAAHPFGMPDSNGNGMDHEAPVL